MSPVLVKLLADYGYIILALTVFAMNAGIPLPGHTAYVVACLLTARDTLSLPLVFAVGVPASFLGGWVGYALGRRGGRSLVETMGPRVGLSAERLAALERFFVKHGDAAVFFLRFVVVVRTFGSIFAGVSQFPARRYLVVSVASAVAWGAVYAAVGVIFGESWPLIEEKIGEAGYVAIAILVVAGLMHVVWLKRKRRRSESAARKQG